MTSPAADVISVPGVLLPTLWNLVKCVSFRIQLRCSSAANQNSLIWDMFWVSYDAMVTYIRQDISETVRAGLSIPSLIARFMGPIWGPPGTDRTQVGPVNLAIWAGMGGSSGSFLSRASRLFLNRSTVHPVMLTIDRGGALKILGPRAIMLEYLTALIFPDVLEGTTGMWKTLPWRICHADSMSWLPDLVPGSESSEDPSEFWFTLKLYL